MKKRIVEYTQEGTGIKTWCIEAKTLFFGLWWPDWSFYSPYFRSYEEAETALKKATGKWNATKIEYPKPSI